jgi:hypothetical protein
MIVAFVRLSEWVPNLRGSRPILAIHSPTRRAYCLVVRPRVSPPRPAQTRIAETASSHPQVIIDRLTGLLGKPKPYWAAGLPLADGCSVECVTVWRHIIYADGDNVAAAQLAIDGEVEQGEVACASHELSLVLVDHT